MVADLYNKSRRTAIGQEDTMAYKILIAEDTPEELKMAVKIANEMGFEVVTAMDATASRKVCKQQQDGTFKPLVDGVVTDIFMPIFPYGHKEYSQDNPCGVLVALAAMASGVPAVFCTSEYHHNAKGQWVSSAGMYIGSRYVDWHDDEIPEEERKFKPWRTALENLQYMIEHKASSAAA